MLRKHFASPLLVRASFIDGSVVKFAVERNSLLFVFACQRRWGTGVGAAWMRCICRECMIAGVCAFKWQLLVMVEPVREKCMIGRHCYLHRLDEARKLFNTLKHFLHTGQVTGVGLRLPGMQNLFTQLSL